jgi:hypothetical protein
LGSAAIAAILTSVLAFFGNVPWWTLPVAAFVSFYFSLTAGMAWERAKIPRIRVSGLMLEAGGGRWGPAIGIFYILVRNGDVPTKITIKITDIVAGSSSQLERSWLGHWRGRLPDFDGSYEPRERAHYGLLGIFTLPSGNPALFLWSNELSVKYPAVMNPDIPIERQPVIRVDIIVNCEAKDGKLGKPMERSYFISPHPSSPLHYRVWSRRLFPTAHPITCARIWRHALRLRDGQHRKRRRKGRPRPNE